MQEGQAKERERGAKEPTPKNIMKETRGWPNQEQQKQQQQQQQHRATAQTLNE